MLCYTHVVCIKSLPIHTHTFLEIVFINQVLLLLLTHWPRRKWKTLLNAFSSFFSLILGASRSAVPFFLYAESLYKHSYVKFTFRMVNSCHFHLVNIIYFHILYAHILVHCGTNPLWMHDFFQSVTKITNPSLTEYLFINDNHIIPF